MSLTPACEVYLGNMGLMAYLSNALMAHLGENVWRWMLARCFHTGERVKFSAEDAEILSGE